jgi:hypothetical protein
MVKTAQIIKSELFQQLSEQEQENISGGRSDFFLKLTEISSSANIKISSLNTTIEINSAYTFRELIISSKGRRRRNRSLDIDSILKLLSRLL